MNLEELRITLANAIRKSEFAGKSYFTGGCVRDSLLGRERQSLDVDIAVQLPQGGIRLAQHLKQRSGIVVHDIFPAFGTAKASLEEIQLEFVMTRSERYQPGKRHPKVDFADLHADAQRRDFSINALYQEILSGGVLDPCGQGLADLKDRTIRSIRDPGTAFEEDPLRILRALRFAVLLEFRIEANTYAAITEKKETLSRLSHKRCADEVSRLLSSGEQALHKFKQLLIQTGIDPILSPKLG